MAATSQETFDKGQLVRLLHEQKFRLTRARDSLLTLFMKSEKMLTPLQLHELAREQAVQVGLTTVYRLLEVMTKVGLATAFLFEGAVYYIYCNGHHHHHFVCTICHGVTDIYECPTFARLPSELQVQYHRVELFGVCASCRSASQD